MMECLCLRCGLCLESCPIYRNGGVGELSSPRGRLSVISTLLERDSTPSVRLLHELYSCTLCRECELDCPRGLPVSQCIMDMRKKAVLKGILPQTVKHALLKAQRYGNPWGSEKKDLPKVSWGDEEYLLFFGCLAGLSSSFHRAVNLAVELLKLVGIGFFTMGEDEPCCGYQVLSLGEEWLFEEIRSKVEKGFKDLGVEKIVTICPHCLFAFRRYYSGFTVKHISEVLYENVDRISKAPSRSNSFSIAIHDSCILARDFGVCDEPRELVRLTGVILKEFKRSRERVECCGGGGGRMWFEYRAGTPPSDIRVKEAEGLNLDAVVTLCPYCYHMLSDSIMKAGSERLRVMDLTEFLGIYALKKGESLL